MLLLNSPSAKKRIKAHHKVSGTLILPAAAVHIPAETVTRYANLS